MCVEHGKRWGLRTIVAGAVLVVSGLAVGCDQDQAWKTFRDQASPAIGDGFKVMLDGVVDGIVAVADPSAQSSSTTTSGSST